MEYLWTKGLEPPVYPQLVGDQKTDVLVIGGGMAGVLCALRLHRAGVDSMLVEAKQIGLGITKGTTAVVSAQHSTLYQDLIRQLGLEGAKTYLDANLQAVAQFRRLAEDISCDFEDTPSILYSRTDRNKMEQEAAAVQSLGFGAEFLTETPLPHRIAGAVAFPGMAQFHPLKFLYGAAKGLRIFENTFVQRLENTTAYTTDGCIRAKKVIVATHFPFINRHGLYFLKLYQKRSFVIAIEHPEPLGCTLEAQAESGVYLRSYGNLLLIGGGDRRTGKKGEDFDVPRAFVRRFYSDAKEVFAWANQDCISLDGVPYIGTYSRSCPNVFVASGFNAWGMTGSMVAAEILTELVLERKNPYPFVFDPSRSMISPQYFTNLGESMIHFVTPTKKRCPHMGCALQWNPVEQSWDCPCHGSRFDQNGHLIDNPAKKDCF